MSIAALDPARTALLVIDMQNAFVHDEGTLGASGVDVKPAQATIAPHRRLIERCRAAGMPVIWTLQVHLPDDASRARKRLASHTAKRKRVSALAGTWDAEIVDELKDLADDPTYVVVKHRFGAFHETRLDALLRMLGVEALLVTGVTANACVETTLREAYLRDYDVVAVTDCIAAVRPEWEPTAHAVWSHYLGELATSQEVIDWLDGAGRGAEVEGLAHLLLQTTDIDAAERFYVDLLGFKVRKRERFRDGRPLILTEQRMGITSGRKPGDGANFDHIAFHVRGLSGLVERARAAGVRVIRGPEPNAYGLSVYLEDPDGNEVELIGPSEEGGK
ncbi:MAG: isochorismatase family protein [Thermoleophilaceae bacterium]|nr:isochorismatase family protein [Thermoleophilaceae bacterium]